jgi:hypothetical protein
MPHYTMRLTGLSDDQNDFVFRVAGQDAGRCYLSRFPQGARWLWTVYGTNLGGLENDLDEAKAAFRRAIEGV